MAEEGTTSQLLPGLGGKPKAPAPRPAQPATRQPGRGGNNRGRATTTTTQSDPTGGLGGNSTGTPTTSGDLWQQGEVNASTKEAQAIPLTDAAGDTLGIHALFPKGSIKTGTYESYVAGVAQMTVANRQNLANVLTQAGILAPHTTGKAYTTSEVQSALGSALSQTFENQSGTSPGKDSKGLPLPGAIPSLTSYLTKQIQQNSGGTVGASAAATAYNDTASLSAALNDSFSKIASSYEIPVSDAAVASHAQAALTSGMDQTQAEANFTEYAKQVAAGLYPSLAPQIQGGVDVSTLLDPYKNLIEKTVGIDPGTIDFTNPKYGVFLNGAVDPATNRAAPMTLSQVSQKLMQDPQYGYQNTQEGKNAASSLVSSLLKTFGAVGQDNLSTSLSGPTPDLAAAQ